MSNEPNTVVSTEEIELNDKDSNSAVHRDQISLLYKQLPFSILVVFVVAPVFGFIIWADHNIYPLIIWLSLLFAVTALRYFSYQSFKRTILNETNIRRWEYYFLAGVAVSALLWGSTCLLITEHGPALHQILAVFILMGLIGGSLATLSSSVLAFRIFMIFSLLPYIIKYLYIGDADHLMIAGLIIFYIIVMIPISSSIFQTIERSLRLHYKNKSLLESYKEADRHNKKINASLLDLMNKHKGREHLLEESQTFLQSILETANDGIITTDDKGLILAINHAVERDFGYSENEMLGKSINIIMAPYMGEKHDDYMQKHLRKKETVLTGRMLDVMGRRKDDSLFPIEITVSETRVKDKIFFTGIIRDISERKKYEKMVFDMMKELADAKNELEEANTRLHYHNKALTKLSEHDALTGLANRRFLLDNLTREWARHQRNHNPLSVVMFDIDFFKTFNDHYGHQAGDECLKQIAEALEKAIDRPGDFIARYGGEEFIAVLPETNLNGACYIAEKIRNSIEKLQIKHSKSDIAEHVTISGGVACMHPSQSNSYEQLIKYSDEALYEAKQTGRNRICKHTE